MDWWMLILTNRILIACQKGVYQLTVAKNSVPILAISELILKNRR